MKATGTTEAGGNLAKAVLLQSYAVKLLAQNKQSEAICSSSMARRVAFEIIKNLGGKEDTFLAISDQEKTLIVNCQGEADILSAAKKELKQLSENDKDYSDAKSLNNNNIDLK